MKNSDNITTKNDVAKPHLPVLIIPGFMSSGLEVKKSDLQPNWEGQRLWLNLVTLGVSSFSPVTFVPAGHKEFLLSQLQASAKTDIGNENSNEETKKPPNEMSSVEEEEECKSTTSIASENKDGTLHQLFSNYTFDDDSEGNDHVNEERNDRRNPSFANSGVRSSLQASILAAGSTMTRIFSESSARAPVASSSTTTSKEQQKKQQVYIRNLWLRHMALSHVDMASEWPGVSVRALQGLSGVDYLAPGTFTSHISYVFGPVIRALQNVGYQDGVNLDASPYDWRLAPSALEKRDQYFTKTALLVEKLYAQNRNTPVVLVCHSMGCKVAHYFFNWSLDNKGQKWLDQHIHTYMAVGGPHLGAPKALRATVVGDRMGLEAFLNPPQGLALGRSLGSTPWLIPPNLPAGAPPCAHVRREGAFKVSIKCTIHVGAWFRYRHDADKPTRLRLSVKYYNCEEMFTAFSSVVNDTVKFEEVFVFREHFDGPPQHKKRCCGWCCLCCIVGCACCSCCAQNTLLVSLCEPGLGRARKHGTGKQNCLSKCWDSLRQTNCWRDNQCVWGKVFTCWYIIKYVLFLAFALLALILTILYWVVYKFWLTCGDCTNKATGGSTVLTAIEPIKMADFVGATRGMDISREFAKDFQCCGCYTDHIAHDEENAISSKLDMNIQWIPAEPIMADTSSPRIADAPKQQQQQQAFGQVGELIHEEERKKKKSKESDCVIYEESTGYNLLQREFCKPAINLLSKTYDADPIDPRNHRSSLNPPPVRRVTAIYGINVPTEVGAIYKRKRAAKALKGKIVNYYTLDTKARFVASCQNGDDSGGDNNNSTEIITSRSSSHGYMLDGGIIKETKDARQRIMSPTKTGENKPKERCVCGDGTVPYWSLQVPRTWQSETCQVEIVELPEAEHREILADKRFHDILVNYVTSSTPGRHSS